MGEKRKKLCGILFAFIICIAAAAAVRIFGIQNLASLKADKAHMPHVYLDAGHGDFDFGAVGRLGDSYSLYEKDLTLAVARLCQADFEERGYRVTPARTGDDRLTYTTAADEVRARRAAAEEAGAELLISIHANAYVGEGRAYGARVYYNPSSEPSRRYAESIAAAITTYTAPHALRECRVVADGSYYVLGNTELPAVLIELGFLSDKEECALLADEEYRALLAVSIAKGVDGH